MNRILHGLALASLVFLLSACGFHLKGMGGSSRPLPFNSVYVEEGSSKLGPILHETLARNEKLVLLSAPKQAEAVLSVLSENQAREVSTINSGGKVNEYLLSYTASVRTVLGGVPVEPDMVISVRRYLNYSDSDVLGKEQEEALLWNDIRRDAAEQLIRRLAYLPRPAQPGKASQSLKPANAQPKP
ncbi:LPS-assembly lipoprotein RlpB precursor [Aquitalea magnusonii]|uniref:LPS-assembly lipoprotein LptE n=1 Tax=Aquitalea magnusonii TaxID=332411 RepID=A0A3G9GLD0_9NEIS|nr:LPS assembly lipoprotein LptE [Aquitalea magnusonii]BBF87379.1 LPS-assembly lipoprotein RlpB precursor [Aquitalea magnusonii]